ncbi:MAG TPA: dihydrofolate reductase [Flavisolibacter sp.]|jgi:dihydrofolate reductase|nr:dihydrofolate reductase [Flavisolibacter sp.]
MILSLLVAASENNVIGKDNKLPWHLPNDLKYFKNLTWGMPILMGRKTFESIGRPLPGRKSIVITRNNDRQYAGVDIVHSIEEAVQKAEAYGVKEIFVIGGAEIFGTALPQAHRVYLTRIHQEFDGDVYFPEIRNTDWNLASSRFCEADEKNKYDHTYQVWERKPGL